MLTPEKFAYLKILKDGIPEAESYARTNASNYVRLQSFWPTIMNGLWNDIDMQAMLLQHEEENDERQ